jgi:hypothetical protein
MKTSAGISIKSSKIGNKNAAKIYKWTVERIGAIVGGDLNENQTRAIYREVLKDPDSPYRKYMTWNVKKGMEKLHLYEIRNIVGSIDLEVVNADGTTSRMRAFKSVKVSIIDAQGQAQPTTTYVPVKTLADNSDLLDQVVMDLVSRIRYWKDEAKKYDPSGIFGAVIAAIEDLDKSIDEKITNMIKDIETVVLKTNSEVKKGSSIFRSCVLLLLAPYIGTEIDRLDKYTGYGVHAIQKVRRHLIKRGIWDESRPTKGHAWSLRQIVLDGFWEDVLIAEDLK